MLRTTDLRACALVLTLLACAGCGGQSTIATPAVELVPRLQSGWPAGLPVDGVQPWESIDADGNVIPAGRTASAVNLSSEFCCGAERQQSSLVGVADNGEACRLTSGDVGSGEITWAYWRLPMDGMQPGAVSADVNPLPMSDGSVSEYYFGLSDYGSGRWQWHGPFSESHLRLSTAEYVAAGSDFLSEYGNLFICVVATDGATFDVVGVAANACDDSDTEAPPAPTGLTATPIMGGLELEWHGVVADDLAGYRLYWRDDWFFDQQATGVNSRSWLEGYARQLLPLSTDAPVYLRVSVIDLSGNESGLSDLVVASPLTGDPPPLQLTTSAPSGMLNDAITLTATGADSYDWDLDGDGTYEVTDDTAGVQAADTSATGMIRPAVRGSLSDESCRACGSVTLLIAGNSRPVASATASPQSGAAPLSVSFTGTAEDGEDEPGDLIYAWDFDGDGTFEADTDTLTPSPQEYTTAGIYGVKFRVEDSGGAWDVDTVPVQVLPAPDPANNAPTAALTIGVGEESGDIPHTVNFDASGSSDPDAGDSIMEYHWDFDGDGMYDGMTTAATHAYTYTSPGIFDAGVLVKDSDGATDTTTVEIDVNVAGNDKPSANLQALPLVGDTPFESDLDATLSTDSDGTIVRYDWDMDGDSLFEIYDGGDTIDEYLFSEPGYREIGLRVTDDDGAQDYAYATITARGWQIIMADGRAHADGRLSMIVVAGKPAIAHEYTWEGDMRYIRANDAAGRSWGDPVLVDGNGSSYSNSALAIVNGNPAIAYMGPSNLLAFVRASDATGSAWGTPVTVNAATGSGYYASLCVVDGNPAITSFLSGGPNDLIYQRATDASGTAWGSSMTLDTTGTVGRHNTLLVVDGYPAVAYRDGTNYDLKFIRATDATGSAWDTPQVLDSEGTVGSGASMTIVDGNPAISYYDNTNKQLKYVRAWNANGSDWAAPVVAMNVGYTYCTSLAVINGHPAICCTDDVVGNIRYVCATDVTGGAWGTPEFVEPEHWGPHEHCCLAEVDGLAAVAYSYSTEWDGAEHFYLKYAIRIE